MIDKVQKIREEVERLQIELIQEKENGFGSDVDDACILELQNVLTYIDSLQEEPVSEELEEAAYHNCIDRLSKESIEDFKAGAKLQKEHLWKSADGDDDLPELEREVIVFTQEKGLSPRVCIAHRPNPNGWDGTSISTGKTEHFQPMLYSKGGWSLPDVKWWLDVDFPFKEDEV